MRVLSLTPTPPANAFVPKQALDEPQQLFPLDVWFCRGCAHMQLLDVVAPALLYEDYVYVSGTSPVFVKHFEQYASDVISEFALKSGDLVVDVGSNDGTLLKAFQRAGMTVLGIDPAKEIARKATAAGIETLTAYFDRAVAEAIRSQHGHARCITGSNVFAHIDDLAGVLDAVRTLLAPEGVFVFEVSYLVDVFEKTLFDTIYHEHLDYHSVEPLVVFFERHGMQLIDARRVPTHGGSLRGIAQLAGARRPVHAGVAELVDLERRLGLDLEDTFVRYAGKIDALGRDLKVLVQRLKGEGKRLAGFGAPAKATTLMYHFGLGPDDIEFIVDDNRLKQGLYSPGLHIPVLPSSAIEERKPDYLLILAWNFAEPIMAKHQKFRDSGGHFIVPVPRVAVY